ncbi:MULTISPECIES: carboxylate-amine ligase [Streptomyces]|uniref:carboxylate-amine ligase n=1 Tax=Streptomyces TaxID=1883 RepID=UPI000996A044|nr:MULTISPECIES: glutamate--cysteine ligase [Streptomyces]MCI4081386.1 glutamate--cysteine ligase [Streptomyces sp. MMS21 TC-5]MEC4573564.1 glutamate--cysteine ligase [Streptomyces sp. CMAA1738]QNE27451.1 YbdK family carboxylate-amine ligase [Streptomyces sp. INR7]RST12116.1 YbdK family carboxylate-amine ligase [Streptomyces sp. WAC05950]GLV90921.1 putative glutamate--cysteine ligase 2 [Streptomyces lavendulae subsp. lavendulae]
MIEPGNSTTSTGTTQNTVRPTVPLTVGVEEEFLLVDVRTLRVVPAAPLVLATAAGLPGEMHPEGTRYQVEISTPVADSAASLRAELVALRRTLGRAARAHGCRLLAAPSPVLAMEGPLHLTDDEPRQREQHRRFGALTDTLVSCGRHVHIGTLDVDTAVAVSNRIRPWLPTLIALAANSPFWGGRDTGHSSWRAMAWSGWPSAGPPPHFTSTAHFRRSVQTLLGSGAALDTKMVYWDLRPSGHWPTLEFRAPDMSPAVDSAVLQAELARALVATALREIREQRPEPALRDDVLRLARWRAAHDGLEGFGLDPYTGAELPAADLAEALLDLVAPELAAAGDLDHAAKTLAGLLRDGSGAHRQRAAYARRQDLTDVLRHLVDETEDF